MRNRHGVAVSIAAGIVMTGAVLLTALPLLQAPNQAQMVTQTVAGAKFSTLPGFVIERINPPGNNDSFVVITFDSLGRLVVSKENDHPRLLLDNDKDGIYESEKIITDKVRNCQGLWFDGRTLYGSCVIVAEAAAPAAPAAGGGRGGPSPNRPAAVMKMDDTNGDDIADSVETIGMAGSIQEHGPHAIRRRPDGGMAVIVGNNETIADAALDLNSPVLRDKDGQFLPYLPNFGTSAREGAHGAIFHWNPAAKKFTVFSGGNRNAYDYGYNLAGEAFLFDSDMEWDIGLPWYREVRTVHEILNGNYGYRNGSGKYPEYYIDSLPPVRDVGRGSPVGVEFYTSYAYPREFFDNLFEADWSRGRLLYTALTPRGATYAARSDRAEFVHGEPFNVTDVEVGPDGLMYFTTGGRNTSGGLWRLRYTGAVPPPPDTTGILAVVRQPQPLSSWGWAAIEKVKDSMGGGFGAALEKLARTTAADGLDRARAIYEMQRHGAPPNAALLSALAVDRNADVRAAVTFVAGVQGAASKGVAATALKDRDPVVRRRAAEALIRMGQAPGQASLAPVADIYALLNDPDRFVRWAGRIALEHTPRSQWKDRVLAETNPLGAFEGMLACVRTANGESLQPVLDKQFAMMKLANLSVENKLRLFRTFMYTTTEIQGGLPAAQREQLYGLVANQFPAPDERLNRELALMIGYSGQPPAIPKLLAAMPKENDNQQLQLQYLYAIRMLKEGWTPEQKTQLAEVLGRASKWRGGAQFINFVGQFFESLSDLYVTDQEKQLLYEKAPDFSPLTPEELKAIQERQAAVAAGRGGQGGRGGAAGRGGSPTPLAARRQGRVVSRQEMLEEAVYQPQQNLSVDAGRAVFEANCASCHRFGSLGADHGVAGLNLTASPLRAAKYALLEAIMFPDRKIAPGHETTIVETTDGQTIHGLVLRESAQSVSLLTREGTETELQKARIKSRQKQNTSLMTEAMADAMNQAQWRNLLAFLTAPPPGTTEQSQAKENNR
jgi:putative heme-binding domain-containing protein